MANIRQLQWLPWLSLTFSFGRQDMIKTRGATPDDKDFLWKLKVASMRRYVEAVYGWDDAIQYGFFEKGFRPEGIQIIQCDERDVGMYELQEQEDSWFLSRIEMLPEFQGQGVGTAAMQQLISQASKTDKPLRLQVFRVNPAQKLYARLGFIKTGETETHIAMELPNKATAADAKSCAAD